MWVIGGINLLGNTRPCGSRHAALHSELCMKGIVPDADSA